MLSPLWSLWNLHPEGERLTGGLPSLSLCHAVPSFVSSTAVFQFLCAPVKFLPIKHAFRCRGLVESQVPPVDRWCVVTVSHCRCPHTIFRAFPHTKPESAKGGEKKSNQNSLSWVSFKQSLNILPPSTQREKKSTHSVLTSWRRVLSLAAPLLQSDPDSPWHGLWHQGEVTLALSSSAWSNLLL